MGPVLSPESYGDLKAYFDLFLRKAKRGARRSVAEAASNIPKDDEAAN
jgi:hypothetical protein